MPLSLVVLLGTLLLFLASLSSFPLVKFYKNKSQDWGLICYCFTAVISIILGFISRRMEGATIFIIPIILITLLWGLFLNGAYERNPTNHLALRMKINYTVSIAFEILLCVVAAIGLIFIIVWCFSDFDLDLTQKNVLGICICTVVYGLLNILCITNIKKYLKIKRKKYNN